MPSSPQNETFYLDSGDSGEDNDDETVSSVFLKNQINLLIDYKITFGFNYKANYDRLEFQLNFS